MRILQAVATAAILLAPLAFGGCAAPMGAAAGNVVGGTAWVVTKGGALAWKGGSFAVKTTGRAVGGAARGVHEEFTGERADQGVQANGVATDGADLTNRVKDQPAQTLSQRQGASLAD
jgi:hypothetical protein